MTQLVECLAGKCKDFKDLSSNRSTTKKKKKDTIIIKYFIKWNFYVFILFICTITNMYDTCAYNVPWKVTNGVKDFRQRISALDHLRFWLAV
jgi:hypothetical protein